jgi:hypothetical protein
MMAKCLFVVRAVVVDQLRKKFDHWYSNDHLPWALKAFQCQRAQRFWSETEQGVHYAIYEFSDKAKLDKALGSDEFKEMVTDFNRAWPQGVTRTRDVITLVEERA